MSRWRIGEPQAWHGLASARVASAVSGLALVLVLLVLVLVLLVLVLVLVPAALQPAHRRGSRL